MQRFALLSLLAACLAYGVVVLGAFVRLSDAGLGCPDWPVCYGRIIPPTAAEEVAQANAAYPHRPVESHKAWKEQVHRYFASALGLLIIVLSVSAWRNRRAPGQPVGLPSVLLAVVIFQGLLGMWTVTLLLKPLVVVLHLLGGMTTLLLLWWLYLRVRLPGPVTGGVNGLTAWTVVAMGVVYFQIALGGWTSSNYAALACRDFPTCHGSLWPEMDFREAFVLWRGLGINYEYGVLEAPARTAIHYAHRVGAVVTLLVVGLLALRCLARAEPVMRRAGGVLLAALALQLGLGVANVVLSLPLPVATAHNGGAALLLLASATVLYFSRRQVGGLPPIEQSGRTPCLSSVQP
jgi:cytochrome c oxidase assembly protein subunit 15